MLIRIRVAMILLLATAFSTYAQNGAPANYEIVVVDVKGCQQTSPEAIRNISGLVIGSKISIPGLQSYQAIRKLLELSVFSDVQIHTTRTENDLIWLEIEVEEAPRVGEVSLGRGLKSRKEKEWLEFIEKHLPSGTYYTKAMGQSFRHAVETKLADSGLSFDAYELREELDTISHQINLALTITQQRKEKLGKLTFLGNENFSDQRLQKALGVSTIRLTSIVPTSDFLEQSRQNLVAFYKNEGFADAKISHDTLIKDDQKWHWQFDITEGQRYSFGTITWNGANRYPVSLLQEVLDIKTGENYSRQRLETRLHFDPEQQDVSALYMDYGHLFFEAQIREIGLRNDSIDIVIDLNEGPIAIVSEVNIEGNVRTNDHVIIRELLTKPGQPFSRERIIRSQRNLMAMGYFSAEAMDVKTQVNAETSEVAITFVVEEERNDKFELSASISPGDSDNPTRLIGTLGFSFNNFSLRGLLSDGWRGAKGDGQQLSIRAQSSGSTYQGYNFSFTEPWLNGKPHSFSVAAFHQRYASLDTTDQWNTLTVTGVNAAFGRRLPWGNGGWTLRSELGYQHIRLNNLLEIDLDDGTTINQGRFNNFYAKMELNYQSLDDQFFPHSGGRFQLSGQWTPPFESLNSPENPAAAYEWLAYHKYRLTAEKYLPLGRKLVLKGSFKSGVLLGYGSTASSPPFERFELGGNGISGSQQAAFAGNDVLSLRGYEQSDLAGSDNGGGVAFTKMTTELRYLILNAPAAKAFVLAFAEAGNAWKSAGDINPFDMNRSVGLGLRLQLPMLGMIGFDYGVGLDKDGFNWNNWKEFGQLNVIFGFEPE